MLEIPVYLLVIGVMGAAAVSGYVHAQRHLHVMESLSVTTGARATMMEYRAVTGLWPTSNSEAGFTDTKFNAHRSDSYRAIAVQIRDGGAIDVRLARTPLPEGVVSIRASEQSAPGLPVIWSCGHALTLPNTISAPDHTTLPDADLPSPCRSHK